MRPERRSPPAGLATPERPTAATPAGPRVLALHLPDLPLQRLARAREREEAGRPVAVVAEGRVVCCDAAACAAGVRPGDGLAQALAACGALLPVAHAPAADLAALRGLAEALLAIVPAVEVAPPDTLLLDAGAAHLLGGGTELAEPSRRAPAGLAEPSPKAPAGLAGPSPRAPAGLAEPSPKAPAGLAEPSPKAPAVEAERRLLARARELAAALGYAARGALATGRGPARALARHGAAGSTVVAPGEEARALAPLPLGALGLPGEVEARLRAVGVDGVGALARLPAEGLALRFGLAGAAAARLARGDDPTPLVPYLPETLPEEAIELEGGGESVEPVLFVLTRLAERVAARLGGRGLGASRLKLTLKLDPRGEERLLVPLARPSAAAARWLLPLRERLLGVRLPGAVTGVRLTAVEVGACPTAQLAFGDRPEVTAALEVVLARLAGRLGDGAISAAEPVDRHRPEAAWRTVPFRPPAGAGGWEGAPETALEPAGETGPVRAGLDGTVRPTRLLATPLPVIATGEGGRVTALRLCEARPGPGRSVEAHAVLSFEGPERLRGEWWSAPFDRDYYRARVEGLGECWLYRDGADGRLWLHGFFD